MKSDGIMAGFVTSCLRCKSEAPLTDVPRNELYFYTGRSSLSALGSVTCDTSQEPRGRLCAACTGAFVEWLKETVP